MSESFLTLFLAPHRESCGIGLLIITMNGMAYQNYIGMIGGMRR